MVKRKSLNMLSELKYYAELSELNWPMRNTISTSNVDVKE